MKRLPGIYQIVNGDVSISKLKDVDVNDLLGRDPINVDLESIMGYVSDKVVMVTGGGGSIGSELCRQVASHNPKQLVLVDIYENSAYDVQQELRRKYPELDLVVVPASGGGLIGGVATAIKGVNADVKVIGAEPSVLPRYSVSMEKGEPTMVPMPEVKSVADALVSNRPGLKCFPVVRDHVDGFAAVDDTYMLKAMKMLLMEGKLLAEPSSCIGMGAVMQGRISVKPEDKVCFVISGGNLGFDQLELLGGVTY